MRESGVRFAGTFGMTHGSRAGMIFFLAAASIGLIFDGAGLGRMTLCAALLHEAGHIAVYVLLSLIHI